MTTQARRGNAPAVSRGVGRGLRAHPRVSAAQDRVGTRCVARGVSRADEQSGLTVADERPEPPDGRGDDRRRACGGFECDESERLASRRDEAHVSSTVEVSEPVVALWWHELDLIADAQVSRKLLEVGELARAIGSARSPDDEQTRARGTPSAANAPIARSMPLSGWMRPTNKSVG